MVIENVEESKVKLLSSRLDAENVSLTLNDFVLKRFLKLEIEKILVAPLMQLADRQFILMVNYV